MKLHQILSLPLLAAGMLTVSCGRVSDCDLVLDDFSEVVQIAPADSVDLEQFGILLPDRAIPYGDWWIIDQSEGTHQVDIVNPGTGEKIECLRRGRGPGEVNLVMFIQEDKGMLYAFDAGRQIYYVLDIEKTINTGQQVMAEEATLFPQDNTIKTFNRPMFMYKCKNGFLATFMNNDNIWFCSLDDNFNVVSSIPIIDFKSTENLSALEKSAFQLSSFFSVSPDGTKGISAMLDCAAFSIFSINSNELEEKARKIYYEPRLYSLEGKMVSPGHERTNTQAFHSAASSDENFFLLFSGKQLGDMKDPTFQCRHLLVYDWDGNPVRRYELEKTVCSIHLQGDRLFCASMHPAPRIYIYRL